MDDMRIEEVIRHSWRPKPPNGMRKRILMLAGQQQTERHLFWRSRWKIALVTFCAAIVTSVNVAENAREERMAAIMEGQSLHSTERQVVQVLSPQEFGRWQSQMIKRLSEMEGAEFP